MTTNRIDVSKRLRDTLPACHTALLVHDVQNDFCTPGGKVYDRAGAGAATSIAAFLDDLEALVAAARNTGVRLIYIKNTHLTDAADLPDVPTAADVPVVAGTWGHQVVDRIAPIAGDIVVEKSGFDIFRYSMLDKVVRARRLAAFVLTGVSTYSGVLASHFALRDLGYPFVLARGAVTGHDKALHDAALAIMAPYAVDTASLLELWKAAM